MGWVSDLLKEYPALSVAKERLALAEARFQELERKHAQLLAENGRLKTENLQLSEKLDSLERAKKGDLQPELCNLLVHLFTHHDQNHTHLDAIARTLGVQLQMARYYLDKLGERSLVDVIGGNYVHGHVYYGLTDQGRAFVVENGLLPP